MPIRYIYMKNNYKHQIILDLIYPRSIPKIGQTKKYHNKYTMTLSFFTKFEEILSSWPHYIHVHLLEGSIFQPSFWGGGLNAPASNSQGRKYSWSSNHVSLLLLPSSTFSLPFSSCITFSYVVFLLMLNSDIQPILSSLEILCTCYPIPHQYFSWAWPFGITGSLL